MTRHQLNLSLSISCPSRESRESYCAPLFVAFLIVCSRAIFAILESALCAQIAEDLDSVVEGFIVGRLVLRCGGYREKCFAKYVLPYPKV